jgi:sulfur-oxidizing protein SoxX
MRHSIMALALLATLAACGGRHSPAGFRLPETGDIARGQSAFEQLRCWTCHTVDDAELPAPTAANVVPLGGAVHELRTDGYLVTSVIHPSHRLANQPLEQIAVEGESRMPDYAQSLTVRQLVDIVAFLQSKYRYAPPPQMYP